jgi:hypothetical protein
MPVTVPRGRLGVLRDAAMVLLGRIHSLSDRDDVRAFLTSHDALSALHLDHGNKAAGS